MKLTEAFDGEILERAKIFGLTPDMVNKLYKSKDMEKLIFTWVKTGTINFATFKKLLVYLVEAYLVEA